MSKSSSRKVYEGIVAGKRLVDIAKENGFSEIYVKKLVKYLIDNGYIIRNPPYSVVKNWGDDDD